MGRGTSDILCHPGDIFRHHQNPDLPRRVGLRTTAKERPGSIAAFRFWQPALAQPHPRTAPRTIRKRMASAFDRQMFADARSASLRKRYSGQPTFRVLFPQGHTLGVGPSEGRALHDRQGKPLAPPRHSASGHRLLLNRIAWSSSVRPQFKALRLSSRLFLRPLAPPLLDLLRMMLFEENPHLDPTQSHSTPCKKKIAPSSQTPIPAR